MAAVAESAPAAGGIDDIVGGLRAMTTESAEGAGETDALTTAELMERCGLCATLRSAHHISTGRAVIRTGAGGIGW